MHFFRLFRRDCRWPRVHRRVVSTRRKSRRCDACFGGGSRVFVPVT